MAQRRDAALLTRRHRTVGRIAAILEAAAADDGVRLSTLATMLDAPKSSIHGLLKGLVSVGYLAEDGGGYSLGPAIHVLLGESEQPLLAEVAGGTMRGLRDEFDETVLLGHRMGDSIVCIASAESSQPVRCTTRLNTRYTVLPNSMGKIYLAELDKPDLDRYLADRVSSASQRKAVIEQLAKVAATGISINRNEAVPGLTATAAGIRERGELVACLSIAGPSDRVIPRLDELSPAVKVAADRVSALLP